MKKTKGEQIAGMIAKVLVVIIIILLAVAACGAMKGDNYDDVQNNATDDYPKYAGVEEYVVQGNDTLLGIACKFCPADADIYRYVRDVKNLNGRDNDTVYWKEVIKVYTFSEKGSEKK